MIIGVLKEPTFETRVSLLAESVASLTKKNIQVWVETGAGDKATCSISEYEKAGAKITSAADIVAQADIILGIHPPEAPVLQGRKNAVYIGVYQPLLNTNLVQSFADNQH